MAVVQVPAYDEFIEFITSRPTLEDMTTFRLSEETEQQISDLLYANRTRNLTAEEARELDEYLRIEHLMRKAKIRAFQKLRQVQPVQP